MDSSHDFLKKKRSQPFSWLTRSLIAFSLSCHPVSVFSSTERSESTIQPNLPSFEKKSASQLPNIPLNLKNYNEKTYGIAYEVFLANGNVEDAYQIALTAVQRNPANKTWKEKLVKAALWSNHPEVALAQWKYFIDHHIEPEKYIPQALKLARQLRDYDVEVAILLGELKKSPNQKELQLQYAKALQNQGYPLKALHLLNQIPGAENDPDYLQQLVIIANGLDEPALELSYLQRLNAINHKSVKYALLEADLLYMQRDLIDAYRRYQSVIPQVSLYDTFFWGSYAEIALLSGYPQSAIQAYQHLLQIRKINQNALFQLLILEQQNKQTLTAYQHAKQGYDQFQILNLAKFVLSLGAQLSKWKEVYNFMNQLPPSQLAQLKNHPDYAVLVSEILGNSGFLVEAYQEWKSILKKWPDDDRIQQSYLWFLLDQHDIPQIEYTLNRWLPIFARKTKLWRVYATALTGIGNYPEALKVFLNHQTEIMQNYRALLDISDLFNQNDLPQIAETSRWRAYYFLMRQINSQDEKPSLPQQLARTELMRALAPAEVAYQNMLHLSSGLFSNEEIDNQMLAWALEKRSYALANYIVHIHKIYQMHTPPWMLLTLALLNNDKMAMDKLVRHSPKLLPYRDRVIAAEKSGNIRAAESYAYQGLKEHPFDSEMYDLFKETLLKRSRKFVIGSSQEGYGPAVGPRVDLAARFFLTPSLSLAPYASRWSPHTKDTSALAMTPNEDLILGLAARKYIDNGWWEVNAADRKSLERTYPVIAKWQRRLLSKLSSEATLSYHTLAPESTSLLLAGMKNEARLLLTYDWDSYNTIEVEGSVQQFLGQDKSHLGGGQELRGRWQSKFYLSYPDWNVNVYGNLFNYHPKSGFVSAPLSRLVPTDQDPNVAFFMPANSQEAAITLGFGQEYGLSPQYGFGAPFQEVYTKPWKPYFEGGISFNTVFGLGPVINTGISGSLFGRDIFTIYGEYSRNQQQGSQKNYIIGIRYENYF